MRDFLTFLCFCALAMPAPLPAGVHRYLARRAEKDTTLNVWVFFTDKPAPMLRRPAVTGRAALRRARAGHEGVSLRDYPVSADYIRGVEREGAVIRHVFKWANA
ncbi:MAG: hypothetical protein GF418_00730, partial [Chitinivibrionales bacterium]|nr:hypothetical protein [Chitinivibrionales bacterium]MBD3394125.1 hypothetical protein [Chitinivibrionales bacterium]